MAGTGADEGVGNEAELVELRRRVETLEGQFRMLMRRHSLFDKAFRVIGLDTQFVEFGAFRGDSLADAAFRAWTIYDTFQRGVRDAVLGERAETRKAEVAQGWQNLRFIAFDSFRGMPPVTEAEKAAGVFHEGMYACTREALEARLRDCGFPLEKLTLVPGWFEDTCVPATAEKLGLGGVGIVHVDCDLYASAKVALDFITPCLADSAVVIFDDWFQYSGHPDRGEQRAFREWREAHPGWQVQPFQQEGPWAKSFLLSRTSRI